MPRGQMTKSNMLDNSDPRTVSRELAGVFETVFPRLVPSMVAYLNRHYAKRISGLVDVSEDLIHKSLLQKAMLFELALAAGERMLAAPDDELDWGACVACATGRQQRYYDAAAAPAAVTVSDATVASAIARNLVTMLRGCSLPDSVSIICEPRIPGFGWIACGVGDYSCGDAIIEAKCASRRFSSADYRQLILYWLLSYMANLEGSGSPWNRGILLNPRRGLCVELVFSDVVPLLSSGCLQADVARQFASVIERYTNGSWD